MKAKDIIDSMSRWAKDTLIDTWDNTGFQVGDKNIEVEKILVALDLDKMALRKAIDEKCQMIITHHPLLFRPLKAITTNNNQGQIVYELIKNNIIAFNAHSNLDLAENGVNDALAKRLGLRNAKPLKNTLMEKMVKLVIYVPESHGQNIRRVLGDSGAGNIGNYRHCTFNQQGIGTFLPKQGSNPYIGTIGKIEEVKELRIETIISEDEVHKVLPEVLKVHPYEEVAYDIYPLLNTGKSYGYGRVGELDEVSLFDYLDTIKENLDTRNLIVYGDTHKKIRKAAVCGGSGADFIFDAYKNGADVYITGDVKYHDAQLAADLGMTIIDPGHYHTEKVVLPVIKSYLEKELKGKVDIQVFMQEYLSYKIF